MKARSEAAALAAREFSVDAELQATVTDAVPVSEERVCLRISSHLCHADRRQCQAFCARRCSGSLPLACFGRREGTSVNKFRIHRTLPSAFTTYKGGHGYAARRSCAALCICVGERAVTASPRAVCVLLIPVACPRGVVFFVPRAAPRRIRRPACSLVCGRASGCGYRRCLGRGCGQSLVDQACAGRPRAAHAGQSFHRSRCRSFCFWGGEETRRKSVRNTTVHLC